MLVRRYLETNFGNKGAGRGWSLVSLLTGENSLLLDGIKQTRLGVPAITFPLFEALAFLGDVGEQAVKEAWRMFL